MSSQLVAENISKQYRKRQVVCEASFKVETGEVVGLLGPNGAGKTTSFYVTVGLIRPNSGRVLLDGQNITKLSMFQRAKIGIGYLPQEPSVFRKLSVYDNVRSVFQLRKLGKEPAHTATMALLDELHITHIKDELGMSLSGGERRRTEIARSLATDPRFILLDEPFAGVDPISIQDIKNIITHLKDRQIGVLITDHNVRETLTICDTAYIMSEGRVIAEGDTKTILMDEQVKRVYLGDGFNI